MTAFPIKYAHSLAGQPPTEWETIDKHAECVAALARSFTDAFGAGAWGELLGRWHDLGKHSDEFQAYLHATADPDAAEEDGAPQRVDHSTYGAQYAVRMVPSHAGQLLAFCIAGHHGHLPDAYSTDESQRGSTLQARLTKAVPEVRLPEAVHQGGLNLRLPFHLAPADPGFQVAFFTRMIYSALIDADRLATEAFCNAPLASERSSKRASPGQLRAALDAHLADKERLAPRTEVNRLRSLVLRDCRAAAALPQGFFSLTVPTGGGKTLASMAFALGHIEQHRLRRVVVAIPFTSIVEQTAGVYRDAFGGLAKGALVEHHSNIAPDAPETRANKLACENWDAPLIVTTNVQLYETLFASRGTTCRKLHRLAGSVIVLDEAQTIPVDLLRPTLQALNELVAHYGCTVVLCSATQPALEFRRAEFEIGLMGVRPIANDQGALFEALRRVKVERVGRLDEAQLAERLAAERSVLCIVNTRAHAARTYDALVARTGSDGCFHLSTLMCAQHRSKHLEEIHVRLKDGRPCRVVSTQLVEAGVDVDFPAVYRDHAGFDSIAQAAGRCNREGTLSRDGQPVTGRVCVFEGHVLPPAGLLRAAAQSARALVDAYPDPIAPEAIEAYFRLLYWSQQHHWDRHGIMPLLTDDLRSPELQLRLRTAGRKYRVIRDDQAQVLVPYGDGTRLRDVLLRSDEVDYQLLRASQRYLVGIHPQQLRTLGSRGVVSEHASGLWLLLNDRAYSPDKGLTFEALGIDPSLTIIGG